jgi:hypothetical protein
LAKNLLQKLIKLFLISQHQMKIETYIIYQLDPDSQFLNQ